MTQQRAGPSGDRRRELALAPVFVWPILRGLVLAMRPRHWSKNLVVLVALIFAREFRDPSSVLLAVEGMALLTLASGGLYLLNDVVDVERDRLHPDRRSRPVAARIVPLAILAGTGALTLAIALGIVLAWPFGAAVACYVALQLVYTSALKHVVIIDILVIATGFVIRAAAGALVIGVAISPWLYLCAFLLALFLGANKRWAEVSASNGSWQHRPVLEQYDGDFARSTALVATASVLMAYALYTFSATHLPPNHSMMLTVPAVLYGLLRYLHLVHVRGHGEAPEKLLYRDPGILLAVVVWAGLSVALLQFGT